MALELVFDGSERQTPVGEMAEFESQFASTAGQRNAADGQLIDIVVTALTNNYWQGAGIHTPVQWLVWRAGICRATARRLITIAARAGELPTTIGLLRQGQLSLDQAHAIARYTPAEYEASVCNLAQAATVNQIIAATRTYSFDIEGRGPRPKAERSVSFGSDDDGSWWARIRLAADEGAVVEEALGKVRDALHEEERDRKKELAEAEGRPTDGTDADLDVQPVSWADAMFGMANSILQSGASGSGSQPRKSVHLHLEPPTPGCGDEWIAELHGGVRLPSWLRQQLTCDADFDIVWQNGTTPFAQSRKHRTPSDKLRRLIERRDRYRCRVPGCESGLWLQAHHITHWEHGGVTATHNLVMLCGRHHRMHHQDLLGISGNPDLPPDHPETIEFTNQYGVALTPPDRPVISGSDLPDEFEPYESPTGERLQKRWVHFNRKKEDPPSRGSDHPPGRCT